MIAGIKPILNFFVYLIQETGIFNGMLFTLKSLILQYKISYMEEKLINTEFELRKQQASLGENLIWSTCIICIILGLLPIVSGGMFNNSAPEGTTAKIILSESYAKHIIFLTVPFIIGLAAGIVLIKSSVKHIAKSFLKWKKSKIL